MTEWLSALGQVVNSFFSWFSSCATNLLNNVLVQTIFGIATFGILLGTIIRIIYTVLDLKYGWTSKREEKRFKEKNY